MRLINGVSVAYAAVEADTAAATALGASVAVAIDPEIFTDIIGRHFREPREGLGFDGSTSAHMWRTMIWPNNFL